MILRQSPIFVRTYDLLQWLLPHTNTWPRQYRFTLTHELVRAALRFQERILEATLTGETARRLAQAEVELAKVRLYLRLGYDLKLMAPVTGTTRTTGTTTRDFGWCGPSRPGGPASTPSGLRAGGAATMSASAG